MTVVLYLLAMSLVLGGCGLAVFLWSLRTGQYEDMDGAANRILFDDPDPIGTTVGTTGQVAQPSISLRTDSRDI